MGRRAKPSKAKAEAKRSRARKSPQDDGARVRDLEQRLAEALQRETATSEILHVISSSPTDSQPVFDAIAEAAARVCAASDAVVVRLDGDTFRRVAHFGQVPSFTNPLRLGSDTATGQAMLERRTIQVRDVRDAPDQYRLSIALHPDVRTILAAPLLCDGAPIGALVLRRLEVRPFSDTQVALLETFADQAVIAIENVRLFRELEAANRELAAASQHKSEFLANMSHELRTPMNAILGFSEILAEGMFGEVNDKQAEYLRDIMESGRHLLSLINDILDLSKIEAGRLELEPTDFDLPGAIDNAVTLVRERAGRRGIMLRRTIDERVGVIRGDERKVKQVLLNLLSNALKFTPEGGRIDVRAGVGDNLVEVSVADTGIGIELADQEAIFEEFRQVGAADKKVEGTGLGLALSRKFIELHGGRIWVESELGHGSTFTFTIPVLREPGDRGDADIATARGRD